MPRLILRLEPLPPSSVAAEASPRGNSESVIDLDAPSNGAAPGAASSTLARWSTAAAAAQDGCIVLDPDGRVVSLSATGADLLDCSGSGVIGRRLLDIVTLVDFETGGSHPDYAERIAPLAALLGHAVHSLVRVRHADDSRLTLDASSVPLHDVSGDVVGSISFIAPLA